MLDGDKSYETKSKKDKYVCACKDSSLNRLRKGLNWSGDLRRGQHREERGGGHPRRNDSHKGSEMYCGIFFTKCLRQH